MDLVFLHGRAATGKLTTARALERRLGWPVFHNHLVVDLLTELFPFGSDPFVRLREQMWLSVIAEAAAVDRSLVFTFTPSRQCRPAFPAGSHASWSQPAVASSGYGFWSAITNRSVGSAQPTGSSFTSSPASRLCAVSGVKQPANSHRRI
jgi:hypothetical protein